MLRILSALTGSRGIAVTRGVPYGKIRRLRLDIHAPVRAADDTYLLVLFHGGSWRIGDKAEYGFVGAAFASAGITVVIPNYRLYPEVTFPDFVRDGAAAVACAMTHVGGHRQVFLAGHSAGAHIAALLNLDRHYLEEAGVPPGTVTGTIGLSGPYDFLPLRRRHLRILPEAVRAASQPIAFVDGKAPPMLLITGDRDRTVKPGNTTRLAAAITAKGGEATVKIYPGVGHLGTMLALARILPYRKPPVRADMIGFMRALAKRKSV